MCGSVIKLSVKFASPQIFDLSVLDVLDKYKLQSVVNIEFYELIITRARLTKRSSR